MKKITSILLLVAMLATTGAKAHEGMWLPLLLNRNYADMKKAGLKLKPEQIYSINKSSLKDAIVSMGGCTAEIISAQGLMLTNHHCGYDAIRSHSTVEADYLTNGFWAMDKSQELPTSVTAAILVRMEDVTARVFAELDGSMSEAERAKKAQEIGARIANEAIEGTVHNAYVRDFFHGNEYYLFVYITYKDVRLVGAPPSSIGKFGGDTDNWMWPRHTGDFAIFRIYSGPDGNPAAYSKDNIPLKPKHHLPISLDGVKEGDFSMIMGFPGSTDRYLTSHGVQQAIDLYNPAIVEIRDLKIKIMKKYMNADPAVRIMLASNYARTANYWKYYIGQTEQLKRNRVYDTKLKTENEFAAWINADPARQTKYGNTLKTLSDYYIATNATVKGNIYSREAGLTGPAISLYAYRMNSIIEAMMKATDELDIKIAETTGDDLKVDLIAQRDQIVTKTMARIKAMTSDHYATYHAPTDKELVAALWKLYSENIAADQQPAFFATIKNDFGGDFNKYAQQLFASSMYTDSNKLYTFLQNPNKGVFEKDMGVIAGRDIAKIYFSGQDPELSAAKTRGYREFTAGLREMHPNKNYYPDANSTPRLTYGNVRSYSPKDGVKYKNTTTLAGVMQKEDPNNDEFVVPAKLKELYNNKDYGRYADKNGDIVVGFISGNDITGGNSGSPVINGKGQLIGCAFDGNWEAMSGDISFEDAFQRTISVDIRYILFIVDKYAGAGHLVDEMTIVGGKK